MPVRVRAHPCGWGTGHPGAFYGVHTQTGIVWRSQKVDPQPYGRLIYTNGGKAARAGKP